MTKGIEGDRQITPDERYDAITSVIERMPGYNCGNPRYFAMMFAATMCCNGEQQAIVLEELVEAVNRIRDRQVAASIAGALKWAMA